MAVHESTPKRSCFSADTVVALYIPAGKKDTKNRMKKTRGKEKSKASRMQLRPEST